MRQLTEAISRARGRDFVLVRDDAAGGGCINETRILSDGDQRYFVKFNRADLLGMFEAEQAGLEEMAATAAVRVPIPLCSGIDGGRAFLVLEHIALRPMDEAAEEQLGKGLAALHRRSSEHFGWERDNTIGTTPQPNMRMESWAAFLAEHRLGFQFKRAERQGLSLPGWRVFCAGLDRFFADYRPRPSLVHGDLWGGNAAMDSVGNPVLYDPACYYGDREVDLAFTEMFGGFGPAFYRAYEQAWPLDRGYESRKDLYNLYHVLNHYNLFGGGYGSRAQGMLARLQGL